MITTAHDLTQPHTIAEWRVKFETDQPFDETRQAFTQATSGHPAADLVLNNLDSRAWIAYLRLKANKGLLVESDTNSFNARLIAWLTD